jgi:hypothetical protein
MALNIKSPRVDALARELAARRGQSITDVIEAGLERLKERDEEARQQFLEERQKRVEALLARVDAERGPDLDPRPLKEIRDELWGGL